ncbi:MAG: preprotein translocase subunit YajC [Lentisphaeria bacterium]|nr:preprotein translocase subunit YajC [Lentisphaeria bacterium]
MFSSMIADAAPAAQSQGGSFLGMMPLILLMVVMFFMMFRSNKKQQQRRNEMLARLTKGTRVIYGGGLIGTIVEVKDKVFVIENVDKSRCEVIQNGIADVYEPEANAASGK